MKKLALIIASTIALTSTANACMKHANFTGFYAGAHLGFGSGTMKQTGNSDHGQSGILGGLHVGFGKEFNNKLFLGLEAFGNFNKTEGRFLDNASNAHLKITRRNEFGAALRPGFVCGGNVLLYVKAGVSSAAWKAEKSKRVTGFVPGVGISVMTSEHVTLGVEGTHTLYKKHHTVFGKAKSHVTDVAARVSYKF